MAQKPVPLSTFAKRPTPEQLLKESAPVDSSATQEKMRQKVFRVTAAQDRKLKEYCAHSDASIQDVVMEGINLVLKSKGLPPI